MKARTVLAALMLANAISLAHAKPDAPPTLPPTAAEQALGPLIDAFLQGQPPGMANFPAGPQAPDFQPYKHEWQSLFDPPQGHAYGHTPEVPEPESYVLMLAGLGMLAAIGRRLRDKGPNA